MPHYDNLFRTTRNFDLEKFSFVPDKVVKKIYLYSNELNTMNFELVYRNRFITETIVNKQNLSLLYDNNLLII